MTSRFISVLSHGASEPKPVVVNVSTTTWTACTKLIGLPSKALMPASYTTA